MDRLPGFRDFYPEPVPQRDVWSADLRSWLFDRWRATARRYGFREYDGPPLEPLDLFTLKSGDEIVHQLYNFTDKGDRAVALRPEMTPTLARMVAAHERHYRKPIKWFAVPQLFRYERQQKGRLREHFQFNADLFGETDPAADAEIVALLIDTLRACGLTVEDFVVRLSSREAWQGFYTRQGGAPERAYDFYQAIDKLEREPEEVSAERLAVVGVRLEEVRRFIAGGEPTAGLAAVLQGLADRGLSDYVRVDYGVIRGLAYYTGTVFEAFDRKGEFRAIAGGGRYDNLVKLISGGKVDLPGLGFGMGDVVLTELLRSRGRLPSLAGHLDVCVLVEDEALRGVSLDLVQRLREAGWAADFALTPMKPDKQFKRALDLGARFTARLDTDEARGSFCRLKHLVSREERCVAVTDAVATLAGWNVG